MASGSDMEVRRDLATWPVAVDKRLDQNAEWIGDLTRRVTKLEIVPYADMVAASKLDALEKRISALEKWTDRDGDRIGEHEGMPLDLCERCGAGGGVPCKCPSAPMPPRARAMPYEGDTMTHEATPSPTAALVERMANAYRTAPGTTVKEWMAAALRVAAEGLLGPMTVAEAHLCEGGREIDDLNYIVKARLAAALEACR